MGRYFALTLGLPAQVQAKTKPKKNLEKARSTLGIWLAVFIVLLGLVYVIEVNTTSTKGYEIKALESQLTDLKEQNKRLELESSSLKSIQHLQETAKTLNLGPSGKVRYIGQNGYAFQGQ